MHKDAYLAHEVPDLLRPYVRRFMVMNNETQINETLYPKPTGYSYFNWVIQGHWQASFDQTYSSKRNALFFTGQIKNMDIAVTHTGCFQHIVAEFGALGLYQLTGIKGIDCRNKVLPTHFANPQVELQFEQFVSNVQKLSNKTDLEQHLKVLQKWLFEMAKEPYPVPDYLCRGVDAIEQSHGLINIKDLCEELSISQRQFTRRFIDIVGISPKYFSRVLQVNKALVALLENDRDYLCYIANEAGFFDESHFIRSVKDFYDTSPNKFLNSNQETLFSFIGKLK